MGERREEEVEGGKLNGGRGAYKCVAEFFSSSRFALLAVSPPPPLDLLADAGHLPTSAQTRPTSDRYLVSTTRRTVDGACLGVQLAAVPSPLSVGRVKLPNRVWMAE